MKEITDPDKVKDREVYFLRKRGAWYRPNAQGYTDNIAEAGQYSAAEARERIKGNGGAVVAVSRKSARDAIWKEMQSHFAKAAQLAEIAIRI